MHNWLVICSNRDLWSLSDDMNRMCETIHTALKILAILFLKLQTWWEKVRVRWANSLPDCLALICFLNNTEVTTTEELIKMQAPMFPKRPSLQMQLGSKLAPELKPQPAIKITFSDRVNINTWDMGVLQKVSGNEDWPLAQVFIFHFPHFCWVYWSLVILKIKRNNFFYLERYELKRKNVRLWKRPQICRSH